MFAQLICSTVGHKINRKRVWDDSIAFRTRCERCGAPLIRENNGWEAFDADRHDHPDRKPHPRFDQA